MEIWIASGNRKELKKCHPFLRDYGVIDVKEIANSLGYDSALNLDDHSSFVLNNEIRKRLEIDEENLNIKSENVHTNLNLNVDDETEEERLDRYADYFERINLKAKSISSKDSTG